MTIETQLLDFTTSDNETLHGLLFSPRERKSDLALLLVHGVAMNFYLPPLPTFGQALARTGLSLLRHQYPRSRLDQPCRRRPL